MVARIAARPGCCLRVRPAAHYHRLHHRHVATTAADAAQQLMQTFSNRTITQRQLLDGNQLQKLSLTLGRRELYPGLDISREPPPVGTPLPPGYHLVYFTPGGVETELGPDGTDRTFNSPAPYTRRMWAGGKMRWEGGRKSQLRVGEVAEERTKLLSATPKRSRDGGEMVLVEVEKEFWGPDGLALVDQRSWIFRPELKASTDPVAVPVHGQVKTGPSAVEDEAANGESYPRRRLKWSTVGLFRFSALTFNGHKIHYDESWTRSVESHPGQVVHGPLNLISMLDYWRDICAKGDAVEITYRAMSPLYAGDSYHIRAAKPEKQEASSSWQVLVEKDGQTCMKGSIKGQE